MDRVFTAGVQYNDWKGSAAADGADKNDIRKFLEDKKLLRDGEHVVGIELFVGSVDKDGNPYVGASAFVLQADRFETAVAAAAQNDLEVRKIDLETGTLNEFFRLFKRFNVKITQKGLNLDGREYREVENL